MKHITFLRQAPIPFDSYGVGSHASLDDAIADMLICERFARESKAVVEGTRLVRFVKPDRVTSFGCYGRGEVAGFPAHIGDHLVSQGYAVLHDAGNGLGVPLTTEQSGQSHGQEIFESAAAYIGRGGKAEGALDPAAVEQMIVARAPAKGRVKTALGM